MKIIDTHQHLWDLEQFPYSWCKDDPILNRSFRTEDYLEATRGLGITKSVHVEADVDEPYMVDETKHILSLADGSTPIEGVVACGRPEYPNFKEYLDQIAGHPKLKGIRRILHIQPDELAQSRTFIENIQLLEQYDLSFDICCQSRQLPVAINLIRECPNVAFILDHCGVPIVKDKALNPWRDHVRQIAEFPNVVCKVSGLVSSVDPNNWTAEDLRPYVEHVINCFGWDRVMFGSDWPVCTLGASFKEWLDAALLLTQDASEENRRKLFAENAERVYRMS